MSTDLHGHKVEAYRNLNKGGYSLRCAKTKRVIAHVTQLTLLDCTFHVQQGGRNRVLATKQKNVHAFIRGTVNAINLEVNSSACLYQGNAYYNPYLTETFIDFNTKQAMAAARLVSFYDNYHLYYIGQ